VNALSEKHLVAMAALTLGFIIFWLIASDASSGYTASQTSVIPAVGIEKTVVQKPH
jgi:hypothetical protein